VQNLKLKSQENVKRSTAKRQILIDEIKDVKNDCEKVEEQIEKLPVEIADRIREIMKLEDLQKDQDDLATVCESQILNVTHEIGRIRIEIAEIQNERSFIQKVIGESERELNEVIENNSNCSQRIREKRKGSKELAIALQQCECKMTEESGNLQKELKGNREAVVRKSELELNLKSEELSKIKQRTEMIIGETLEMNEQIQNLEEEKRNGEERFKIVQRRYRTKIEAIQRTLAELSSA
jgi:chromosome segregation ATPase